MQLSVPPSVTVVLARERGPFPAFDASAHPERPFIAALPAAIRAGIARHGIRNSHLLAIAPAGSISVLANNVSSGIEPLFGITTLHRVLGADGRPRNFQVTGHAYTLWRTLREDAAEKPAWFVEAESISPRDHLLMQAALSPYVDGSISKTVSLSRYAPPDSVAEIFETAHRLGLKGCAVFRAGSKISAIARHRQDAAIREAAAAEYGRTEQRAND